MTIRKYEIATIICGTLLIVAAPAYSADTAAQSNGASSSAVLGGVNVQWFGTIDVGVSSTNSGYGNQVRVEGGGGESNSALGVDITKDLGGGYRAVAKLEGGLLVTTGDMGGSTPAAGANVTAVSSGGTPGTGPQLFARTAWGGMQTPFGQLTVGRQYTTSYIAATSIGSAYGQGLYGLTAALSSKVGTMPTRVNNSIAYSSPNTNGFVFSGLYTAGAENNLSAPLVSGATTSTSASGQGSDFGLRYSNGPFNAALTTWSINAATYATAGETGLATNKGYLVAANYDFGFAKLAAQYVSGSITGGNYENITKVLSDGSAYGVSAVVPVGTKNDLIATYTQLTDSSALNKSATLVGLSDIYHIDKMTSLYFSYGVMQNSPNSSYSLTDAGDLVGNIAAPGTTATGFSVGFNYRF